MKLPYDETIEALYHVLNPHGSDETLIVFQLLSRLPEFLTHTVQMKHISSWLFAPIV